MKYRVLKDNFLWKKNAILHYHTDLGTTGGYKTDEKDYQQPKVNGEYISAPIIENSPDWFEPIEDTVWEKFVAKVEQAKKDLAKKMREEWRK